MIVREIDAALERIDAGHVRHLRPLRAADPRGAARRPSRTRCCASRASGRRSAGERARTRGAAARAARGSRRLGDERAAAGARAPRGRSPPARPSGWGSALVAVAAACADQLTKALVSNRLSLGGAVDVARPVHDPPRPQHGDRVRAVRRLDVRRDRAHRDRDRRARRVLRPLGRGGIRCCPSPSASSSAGASRTSSTACGSAT